MSASERSRLLESWAVEAGFDRAGVASLEPSEHRGALERWLKRGDQAGMSYLERRVETRLDPARLLEGGRSAVCVALHYAPLAGGGPPEGNDLWPKVARYARGDDYHGVMERRLDRLAERVELAFPGCRTRRYVDTGPILERELAQRAGLGRIGKNTNLLSREGSWFLLGELLTTLELEPSEPIADLCGECTLCLDACPTGALPEPYRLDSRRCISYWTIEHRGWFPRETREWLGEWLFGCDICQEVCPWNSHRHRRSDTAGSVYDHAQLEIPEHRRTLGLVHLLALDRERYVELFRRSPMKRSKLDGLRRNAAITLGHAGSKPSEPGLPEDPVDSSAPEAAEDAIEKALVAALSDPEELVRGHAAWALARLGGRRARPALRNALAAERSALVRSEIVIALGRRWPEAPPRKAGR